MKRKCIFLLIIVFVFNIFVNQNIVNAKSFSDVNEEYWAFPYIEAIRDYNIVNGYEDGSFKPEDKVKVGEFVKMVAMAMHPKYKYVAPSPDEVDGTHWSKPYVLLLDYTILNAYDYNDEIMEKYITREEASVLLAKMFMYKNPIIARIFNEEKSNNLDNFTDCNDIIDENKVYINLCVKYGLINGFPDGTFKPKDSLTRAQAVKLLYLAII